MATERHMSQPPRHRGSRHGAQGTPGIDIAFTREGRAGTRMIRMNASYRHPPETVSTVSVNGCSQSGNPLPGAGTMRRARSTLRRMTSADLVHANGFDVALCFAR